VARSTQSSAAASEELTKTSQELSAQATQLQGLVGFFNIGKSMRGGRDRSAKRGDGAGASSRPAAQRSGADASEIDESSFTRFN